MLLFVAKHVRLFLVAVLEDCYCNLDIVATVLQILERERNRFQGRKIYDLILLLYVKAMRKLVKT